MSRFQMVRFSNGIGTYDGLVGVSGTNRLKTGLDSPFIFILSGFQMV